MKANTDYLTHYSASARQPVQTHHRNDKPAVWMMLSRLAERLMDALSSSPELRVRQLHSRTGEAYWEVYDPMAEQTTRFASEAEVRRWIEQRYYQ